MSVVLTPEERTHRDAMIYGSVELARRIALSGKSFGPCCEQALIRYVQGAGEDPTLTPRQRAIKCGHKKFHGSACMKCGHTLRDTSTCHCVNCRILSRRQTPDFADRKTQWGNNRQAAMAQGILTYNGRPCPNCEATDRYVKSKACVACSAVARIKHRQVLAENARIELEKIAENFGVTLDQALTKMRTPDLTRARHQMWTQLRHRGYSFPRIGSIFSCDHSTVQSAVRRAAGWK